jgi:transposase
MRERDDVLEATAGLAGCGRLGAPAPHASQPLARCRADRLEPRLPRQRQHSRKARGRDYRSEPDRPRPPRNETAPGCRSQRDSACGAHHARERHDSRVFEVLLGSIPPVRRKRAGRPRRRPEKVHADKAYDFPRCRTYLRRRGITARVARRGVDSSERLGRYRWVVERTLAWLSQFRRLAVRYERRADIPIALTLVACAVVCLRFLQRGAS